MGVGLIGGSLALSARIKGIFNNIIGIGRTLDNLRRAKELGVIDEFTTDFLKGVENADLVVVATPVSLIVPLIEKMLPHLKEETIITDVGSVKAEIMDKVDGLLLSNVYFVGGHPIAGTENSGVEAAFSDLFERKKCILTPSKKTNPSALEKVKNLWISVGSEVVFMDSERHDKILGAVSHLPHFIAFALVSFLNDIDEFNGSIFEFSAGGLKDFTRIAASHPFMWKDIALMNRTHLVELIEQYQKTFDLFKDLINKEDSNRLLKEIQKSRNIRKNIIR
ncbi:MAG: prephenate dehydrogenase/arogenate dehydrogenase family protein [Deltaproteobacteria bacterium]|nr:prephenate dehydrogenase/arogenate dehydrogenase family protein [Deltaproteobacteria bacterium]